MAFWTPRAQPGRRAAITGLLSLWLLGLAACSHYQLGTQTKLAFTTLYVAPVENAAMLPQVQMIVATEIRHALLQDGRVTLVNSPETADVTVHVTLTGYERQVVAASSADTGLTRKFALVLRASCTLTDNRTKHPLFANRALQVSKDAYTDSGQLQAEYQALPLLAGALGGKVAHTVLDVW
jgi:hypothetical protein